MATVEAFAIRHAEPLSDDKDSGIDPARADQVDGAAWAISVCYEDDVETPRVTVFTSPTRRAIETAERFMQSTDLFIPQAEPFTSPALAEDAFAGDSKEAASEKFSTAVFDMAKVAVADVVEGQRPILVLITHEPTLNRLPHLGGRHVSTDHTSLNHFEVEIG